MTKKELMNKIATEGAWIVNENGYYLKAWKEAGFIILRAYCADKNGGWIPETYKRKENEIMISEENGVLHLSLADEWINNVDESECPSDKKADEEYTAGIENAVFVENDLATSVSIDICSDEIQIFQ